MEEPIRVAQIIGKMVGGGVEAFIMNYYKHMDRSKIQFDFIIDSDSTNVPRDEIENLGGKIIVVPPYQKLFDYTRELTRVLKQNDYKIVHAHLNTLSIFPLFCAWRTKIPVRIAHSHSTSNKKEWKKNIIKNILRPFSKIFATHYFACSEHAGRWLFGNKTFNKGKVKIIPNAIEIEKFEYNEKIRNKVRKKLEIEDKLVVGHVGRFVKQKNHEFLIDIFNEIHKENNNFILLLIGEGPLEEKIRNKVNKLNLQDNVKFLGIRNDVNELMQAMDLFLFPSLYEGLGIVIIEAQVSNLPVLCSAYIPKTVKLTDCVCFFNLSEKKSKIFNKISYKLNEMKRKNNTQILVKNGYDIKVESKKMEKYYKELGNSKTRRDYL